MKMKKAIGIMKKIFGYGILSALVFGCLMFFAYMVAFVIGGGVAAKMCHVIYKVITPVFIYSTSIFVIFGLVVMYIGGEVALSSKKGKDKRKAKK